MTRTIKEGDRVTVCWHGGEGAQLEGIVMHVPVISGDLWYIRRDNGTDYAINPRGSEFDCIIKEPEEVRDVETKTD